jgi:hypothetical protein
MIRSSKQSNSGTIYYKEACKGDNKTFRFTCDSTAFASCKISKHDRASNLESKYDRASNLEDIHNFHKDGASFMLFRASTAKMERK